MAEFTEVMRQAKRMCAAYGGMCKIRNCPMVDGESCRFAEDKEDVDYNEVERIIMAWAAEHPAPRYPTWREWDTTTFPDVDTAHFLFALEITETATEMLAAIITAANVSIAPSPPTLPRSSGLSRLRRVDR